MQRVSKRERCLLRMPEENNMGLISVPSSSSSHVHAGIDRKTARSASGLLQKSLTNYTLKNTILPFSFIESHQT